MGQSMSIDERPWESGLSDAKIALIRALTALAGQRPPFLLSSLHSKQVREELDQIGDESLVNFGISKLNELLLFFGYDRIGSGFFAEFLAGPKQRYIPTISDLQRNVDGFRIRAIHLHGNVKYSFKKWRMKEKHELEAELSSLVPRPETDYSERSFEVLPIQPIPKHKTHYLGYISGGRVRKQAARAEATPAEKALLDEVKALEAIGVSNHLRFLTADHLDVYVATSMRLSHEFVAIGDFLEALKAEPGVSKLRLQFFDPTLAYCPNRVDKGLVEALMLRRAKCTLYLAQEGDTLGKDSELASTLAQGKPVIAFVPDVTSVEAFERFVLDPLRTSYIELSDVERLALFMRSAFASPLLDIGRDGHDEVLLQSCLTPHTASLEEPDFIERAHKLITSAYDKRADTLQHTHPLGLQVNLESGVANGVLVVRNIATCARLLRSVMLNELEFKIIDEGGPSGFVGLQESISECLFRVVTKDEILTNSFWNFYPD